MIDEKEIAVTGLTDDRAQEGIVLRVDVGISSAAGRPVQAVARLLRVGVGRDEERLQRDRHVLGRHIPTDLVRAGWRLECLQTRHD